MWRQSESGTCGFSFRGRQTAITWELLIFGDIDVQGVVPLAEHQVLLAAPLEAPLQDGHLAEATCLDSDPASSSTYSCSLLRCGFCCFILLAVFLNKR